MWSSRNGLFNCCGVTLAPGLTLPTYLPTYPHLLLLPSRLNNCQSYGLIVTIDSTSPETKDLSLSFSNSTSALCYLIAFFIFSLSHTHSFTLSLSLSLSFSLSLFLLLPLSLSPSLSFFHKQPSKVYSFLSLVVNLKLLKFPHLGSF